MGSETLEWIDTAPADLGGYSSRLMLVDGIPTRYYDVGRGTPLVLLHGAGWRGLASGNTFVPLFPHLIRHFRLIAPDKLASGLTGNPKSAENYTSEALVEHMGAFIRGLDLGDEVFLLGQSMGGYLATRLALENQDIVSQLVIVNSATLAPDVGDFKERRRALFGDEGVGSKTADDPTALLEGIRVQIERLSYTHEHITDDFLEAKLYMEQTQKSRETLRVWAEEGGEAFYRESQKRQKEDTLTRLAAGELNMPVLIYWGADDPSALLEQGHRLFDLMRANNDRTRMIVTNGAGHFHYRERPREFSYNVRNFLEFWRGIKSR